MKVLRLLGRHKWRVDSNSFVMRMALGVLLPAVALSACSAANLANPSSDLGAVWNWDAATSVEGDAADECPESGSDWRNPKMEQFPSN
jgi:hypothetical protein